jgi:LPXTG-motif cell wall-anchored protein
VYADEATLDMPDTDTTLYAVWKENTTYTVTYKVVGGTWSNGSTTDKTETVQSGSKPASVPTGMKASQGYTGGAWDTNPADATITGATTFTYTFTAIPTYTVTYKVVNGTWSDDSTTDKTETVQSGSKPASVPTGMKASQGFTGGAWDENPADATITGATTFTYTFTAIPTYTVTYKVVGGTWSDDSTTDKTETVQSGSKPASVPTGMKASEGYTGGAWDTNPADATITGATTFTYTFTAKQAATVTKAPTAKNLTYNGSAQELVTAGEATGGTMQYALGTATEATEQYTTSIPTATNAGTYYVWYKAKGDDDHLDSDPRCVTVYITNALYTVTSVENWEHTIDYPNDIIITVKRNTADNITYSMYTGASVDGNGIPADGSSVAQGSLILTLKGSYLDTLSTGTHKVTISFKDGSADATISIVNAPPAPTAAPTHVPKTGDGANLVLWIGLILLGFLGIIAFAGMAGRKHRNR